MTTRRAVLLALNLVLVSSVVSYLGSGQPLASIPNAPLHVEQTPLVLPTRKISLPALDRPLFSQPPAPPAATPPVSGSPSPEMRLVGVLLLTEGHVAFIEQKSSALKRIREGDEIDGWTVTSIGSRAITLSSQEQTMTYKLDPDAEEALADDPS